MNANAKTNRDRSREECTRDVIFLFQYRFKKTTQNWVTEGVWLDREEAEYFGRSNAYNYPGGWRVYGIPANGELAEILHGRVAVVGGASC